jgi:hypothetical protein
MELETEKGGLFTHYFLSALSSPDADADGDGNVSAAEFKNYLTDEVARQARLLGSSQEPEFYGKNTGKVTLPKEK